MKENKYDNPAFFAQYGKMPRSVGGLDSAGEWHALRELLPDFHDKSVLDLGCGYGWHCRYAIEHGARSVVGVDLSQKMLEVARANTPASAPIRYVQTAIEDFDYPENSFDAVISSLALHYVASLDAVFQQVARCLSSRGHFVFSTEHPVFTAQGPQDWHYAADGKPAHWPVDDYFHEGKRTSRFLGENVTKYHRTLTSLFTALRDAGFDVTSIVEPQPPNAMLKSNPAYADELRRPMMLLVAAIRKS